MSHVVVSHAHHPDEGVYRLVFAQATQTTEIVEVPNPDDEAENPATVTLEVPKTVLVNHADVVWADDDDRWEGLEPSEIARQQRGELSAVLFEREAEARVAAREAANRTIHDLGGANERL